MTQSKIDWNLDPDQDGLKNWQEINYGLDPDNPDSDGDGKKDFEEIRDGSDPREQDPKQQLKEQYYNYASRLLGWEKYGGLNWNTLYSDIQGNEWTGQQLDAEVVTLALKDKKSQKEAVYLLMQSPYLQYLKEHHQIDVEKMKDYALKIVDKIQGKVNEKDRKQQSRDEVLER